ncbi:MAG: nicotinate (nicotinamide) nucleotide adenylyltransferase [Deltaproteobacteria bacterium]|nr:nicotinate (nicotinamide) nucleotide adenylyltransferase [Deltaproteobacteria bacterium]
MNKVALLGGMFDPIHWAHVRVAKLVIEKYKLDQLYFVPAWVSPHKTHLTASASASHRLAMVQLALHGLDHVSVCEFEINQRGVSYTIDTLRHYRKSLEAAVSLYLVVGSDVFLNFENWKDVQEIICLSNIIVVYRPEFPFVPLEEIFKTKIEVKEFETLEPLKEYRHTSGKHIYYEPRISLDISSSAIRRSIQVQQEIYSYVPQKVAAYIYDHKLYQKKETE